MVLTNGTETGQYNIDGTMLLIIVSVITIGATHRSDEYAMWMR